MAWVDGVCGTTADLAGSTDALAESVKVPVTGSGEALAQIRSELRSRAQAVRTDASALADAVQQVPAGVGQAVADTAASLQDGRQAVADAAAGLSTAVDAVSQAQDASATASAVADLVTRLPTLKVAVEGVGNDLSAAASTGASAVRDAFAKASACAPYAP